MRLANAALTIVFATNLWAQTPMTFSYIYDDTGQLVKAVDSTGIAVEYVYDAVGNMLEIKRSVVPAGALAIYSFSPAQGAPSGTLTIRGQGFSPTPSANIVRINGVSAQVLSASVDTLVVAVPLNATSGQVSVTVGTATATSSAAFVVSGQPVITSISPKGAVAGTSTTIAVNGIGLSGSTFAFLPMIQPPVVVIDSLSVNAAGTVATIAVTIAPNGAGQYAVQSTTAMGSSSGFLTTANAFTVAGLAALSQDPDSDGLSTAQEVVLGTDPLSTDSDGDGFPDGVEAASVADPTNSACTPLNCRLAGETESLAWSVSNFVATPSAPHEAGVLFSLLNQAATSSAPHESGSLLFSLINLGGALGPALETESVVFSVINDAQGVVAPLSTGGSKSTLLSDGSSMNDRLGSPHETETDSDGDGLSDEEERTLRTNPSDGDSDGDGFPDGLEVELSSDPLDASRIPDVRPPGVLTGPAIEIRSPKGGPQGFDTTRPKKGSDDAVKSDGARAPVALVHRSRAGLRH